MILLRSRSRLLTFTALSIILVFATLVAFRHAYHGPPHFASRIVQRPISEHTQSSLMDSRWSHSLITFCKDLEQSLLSSRPNAKPVRPWRTAVVEELPDIPARVDYINIDQEDVEALNVSHRLMVESLERLAPQLPYQRGTRGFVTTAGGKYFGIALISIRMLRRSGSKLPIEVFLDSWDDYDFKVCEHILPSLDAKCVVLAELWSITQSQLTLERYQYKVFALVLSSFEEIIFLDADAFPAHSPDYLLDIEPFRSTGLVTWPDFWVSSSSHYFYEIVGLEVPPVTLRRSSESSIMMYSKRMHAHTLLLSAYYNYYGPSHYYPLLSQGATGEGDKETFLHAALALQKPFYDVHTPVTVIGDWVDGTFNTAGLKQADPAEDWKIQQGKGGEAAAAADKGEQENRAQESEVKDTARPFFMHHNIEKLDVKHLFESPRYWSNYETHNFTRMWGDTEGVIRDFGYDMERALWEEIVIAACEMDQSVCERTQAYFHAVFPEG